MFCVIYQFKVIAEKEEQFVQAWENLTLLIYQYEGSLGSRLHQEAGRSYIAYAQWPSKEQWQESGSKLPKDAEKWSAQMRDSCDEIKTLSELNLVSDLLKKNPHSS